MSRSERHEILTGDVVVAGGWEFPVLALEFTEWSKPELRQRGARLVLTLGEPVEEEPDPAAGERPRLTVEDHRQDVFGQ